MPISDFVARLRVHVGNELLLLPSVCAIVFDADDRLLVALHDNGTWAPPGGAVEPDERPVDAIVREVREELNVDVAVRGLLGTYGGPEFRVRYANGDEVAYVISAYVCEIVGGRLTPDEAEITDVRFVHRDELSALHLSPWTAVVLPEAFAERATTTSR